MTDILVAGNVGVDQIWRLDRALRPGRRLHCVERVLRVGGGAANTGAALLGLGRAPLIAARIATDALGETLTAALAAAGLDMRAIERVPGATTAGVILLEPDGERTLIAGAGRRYALPAALGVGAEVVYVNFSSLADPGVLASLGGSRWVVAQMPLDLDEPRPAHMLIASRSDVDAMPVGDLWARRRGIDGDRLRHVIVTGGGDGVEIVGAEGTAALASPVRLSADSIGAGDFFAAGLLAALFDGAGVMAAVQLGQQAAQRFLLDRPALLRVIEG